MTNSVRPANLSAILAVGEELRLLLHDEQPPLIKDRRYHLKLYPQCFVGSELVDWLLSKGEVNSRIEAVAMMQKLCENGVIHHGMYVWLKRTSSFTLSCAHPELYTCLYTCDCGECV